MQIPYLEMKGMILGIKQDIKGCYLKASLVMIKSAKPLKEPIWDLMKSAQEAISTK